MQQNGILKNQYWRKQSQFQQNYKFHDKKSKKYYIYSLLKTHIGYKVINQTRHKVLHINRLIRQQVEHDINYYIQTEKIIIRQQIKHISYQVVNQTSTILNIIFQHQKETIQLFQHQILLIEKKDEKKVKREFHKYYLKQMKKAAILRQKNQMIILRRHQTTSSKYNQFSTPSLTINFKANITTCIISGILYGKAHMSINLMCENNYAKFYQQVVTQLNILNKYLFSTLQENFLTKTFGTNTFQVHNKKASTKKIFQLVCKKVSNSTKQQK
eukprot:TRINITY_DN8741_c0_g1_i2.p1 TRINITY_DN8741_c0_g1~~TRINITY_DN8741_c0_g1_i2.p1  ORF type:complete len:271 (+),score=-15.44 TRINITY_DN8741_c0_g1_i2:340-1152(+)